MLGVTSYQEALRALGGELEAQAHGSGSSSGSNSVPPWPLRLKEVPEQALIQVSQAGHARQISASELQQIVVAGRARRGGVRSPAQPPSALADLMRSVGFALDDLHAHDVELEVRTDALEVRFRDRNLRSRELTYAGEELSALREVAAARRKGDPLSRVLILDDDPETVGPLRELLVAEFAVQVLPWLYAPAVAESGDPPDLVLTRAGANPHAPIEVLRVLRAAAPMASVPILVVAAPGARVDADAAFDAGADDVLQEPIMPALLRARLRTCLLRGGQQSTVHS
jgi:CheY-like chemotaxis protein